MAKISANGAYEVARVTCLKLTTRIVLVSCSDGRVLRKIGTSGYQLLGKVRNGAAPFERHQLAAFARGRGYVVEA